jgi:hypothetical protein
MRRPTPNPYNWDQMSDEQINSQLYKVETQELYYYPQGYNPYSTPVRMPCGKVAVRMDTKQALATVGNVYKAIDTKRALDEASFRLTEAEIKHKVVRIDNSSNGAIQNVLIALDHEYNLEPAVGDVLEQYFMLGNSYNGLTNLWLNHFIKRLTCLNGAMSNTKDFSLNVWHKGDTNRQINDGLNLYLTESIKATKELYEYLGNTKIDKARFDMYVDVQQILAGEHYKERIKEETTDNTMFSAYQAFTKVITHEYGRSVASKLNKFRQLNKETNQWEKLFGKVLEMVAVSDYYNARERNY